MSMFNRLFSSQGSIESTKSGIDWRPLNDMAQLDEIEILSNGKKVLIFKHSTRCGISSMVLKQFEQKFQPEENTVLYFLDLLKHREISNAIALRFGVTHQSPQLLVIEKGACTRNASHYGIVEMVEL